MSDLIYSSCQDGIRASSRSMQTAIQEVVHHIYGHLVAGLASKENSVDQGKRLERPINKATLKKKFVSCPAGG